MIRRSKYQLVIVAALVLALAAGCVGRLRVGDVQTKTESVAREDAAEVDVRINMGAGRLQLGGGADGLMTGEFTYNVERWEPEVAYEVRGDIGYLNIEQPAMDTGTFGIPDSAVRNEWDLRLAEDVPMNLEVNMGATDSDLDLRSLTVNRLTMNSGAGNASVSLGGTLSTMNIQMGAGELRLSFNDEWQQNLEATISAGVGQLTLLLPADSGVRVSVEQGLGNVNATNLRQDGNVYVNEAYGQAESTLNIRVEGGVGEVALEVLE
ncbi:MAG TPA: toast rack family protein [Candidatus Sulfomarinibacteraceae bacterium]|nr:toast rack family protein [Candidatus Sulfomarinibacteraceae bacterium]